jgi:F420-non-reducing hydrogenase iron-sulfur subunit
MSSENFDPTLIGFLCTWCSYTGADLAGTARMTYSPNIRIIRVMCSGRVDPQFVIKAFKEGADGILISGCHPGDCHYKEGNYKALRRHRLLRKMLEQFCIEKERLRLEWVSAAEGAKFQNVCDEFTEQIKELGPLNIMKGDINEYREA